jgi:TonB-linked SusC/RagA family outer membrane protein
MKKLNVFILLFLCPLLSLAQVSISGKVTDENNQPLRGVSITIKGTKSGSTTSDDGTYAVNAPDTKTTLIFSFVGFSQQEIPVGGNTTALNVKLQPLTGSLSDVVVVGYGTQKKINLTGAVSQISGKQLEDRPVQNMTKALQGQIPNVNITFGSGKPGAEGNINIRGTTSINGGSPLVLIDGVPGNIDRINPQDVESISVLKDASASAIYGARGSFGVVLVTTKKAKSGKATINYSNNFGWATQTTSTNFMTSGYELGRIMDTADLRTLGISYMGYTEQDYDELKKRINDKTKDPSRPWVVVQNRNGKDQFVYYGNFDWWHYLYNTWQPNSQHNVSITGATDKISYLLSGGYRQQDGIWKIRNDENKIYNFRSKIDAKVTPWLQVTSNTQFFNSAYKFTGANGFDRTFGFEEHLMPAYSPINPDGSYSYLTGLNNYKVGSGEHADILYGKSGGTEKTNDFRTTIAGVITVNKHISLTGNYSFNYTTGANATRKVKVPYSQYPGVTGIIPTFNTDQLSEYNETTNYQVLNLFGNYENTFGNHHVSVLAGFNQEHSLFKSVTATRADLLSLDLNDLNLATGVMNESGGASEWALQGYFYRLNYDYKGKYLFEASGRYDGTSRFKSGQNFGFFPSFSAGWRISEEAFFEPVKKYVNNLKFRASYGALGNQQVSNYSYLSTMGTAQSSYLTDMQRTLYVTTPAAISPTLTWEKVTSTNFGVDVDFLRSRLFFVLDIYDRKTTGMLIKGRTLPSVFGTTEPKENAADLATKGFELTMGWRDNFKVAGKPLSYNFGVILSDYTSIITKFDNPNNLLSDFYVGKPFGVMWGYRVGGLFQSDEEAQQYGKTVNQDYVNSRRVQSPGVWKNLMGGDMKFLDLNGDNVINVGKNTLDDHGDLAEIGNTTPRYSFGINTGAEWGGFSVSVFIQGIGKRNWYPNNENSTFYGPYSRPYVSFIPANFKDLLWSPANRDGYYPLLRAYIADDRGQTQTNDYFMQDLAYIRLKNLTVGYNLPERLIRKVTLSRCRVYVSGENLLTKTKLRSDYIDPEQAAAATDGKIYPFSSKMYSFGFDISF